MTQFIGRDTEVATLHSAIESPRGRVIVVSGAPGSGKSTMLGVARRYATSLGHQVIDIAGLAAESSTPLAGLHRLLRAVNGSETFKYGRANIIETLFGTSLFSDSAHTGRLAIALLELLDSVPRQQPVLVSVDDAQWLDEQSRNVLLFAARRSAGRPITVALSVPETSVPAPLLGPDTIEIRLAPMGLMDSIALLEAQPAPPSGLLREQVLKLSAGNPAAIVHFGRAAVDRLSTSGYAPAPLPLPIGIHAGYARRLARLPVDTRWALVVIAAASPGDLNVLDPGALTDLSSLAPAETAGIVRVESSHVRFVSPLLRSAAYYDAPLSTRLAAHRQLSEVLTALPYRRIWHLAQATTTTDSALAEELEKTYEDALHHDGYAAAAMVLQRAAALTGDDDDKIRLLLQVCELARKFGDLTWAARLSKQALSGAIRPQDRIRALTELGLATLWSDGRAAIATLVGAADEALRVDSELAWAPLQSAAAAAFLVGDPAGYREIARVLRSLDEIPASDKHEPKGAATSRLWIRGVIDPSQVYDELFQYSEKPTGTTDIADAGLIGLAAGVTDQADLSVRYLRYAGSTDILTDSSHGGSLTTSVLAAACMNSGRWDEALRLTDDLHKRRSRSDQPLLHATGKLIRAAILARRGDSVAARENLSVAVDAIDFKDNRAHAAWANHALGMINLVENHALTAYGHLAELFSDSGVPLHDHASVRALVDFADAAVLADLDDDARQRLPAILSHIPQPYSARVSQLVNHTTALLGIGDAGATYAQTLAEPAGEQWPFERARVRLSYAGWLRRNRRRKEAQQQLSAAMAIFEKLGAKPWLDICAAELRASGVRQSDATDAAVAQLSPQQHQVVYLASLGFTNPQIAARLHLSARTVSGYLYRSFPKLGVTSRHQIRDIPAPTDWRAPVD